MMARFARGQMRDMRGRCFACLHDYYAGTSTVVHVVRGLFGLMRILQCSPLYVEAAVFIAIINLYTCIKDIMRRAQLHSAWC